MQDPTRALSNYGRYLMSKLARVLNNVTRGKVKPAHITTLSLLGHIPAAWALYTCRPVLAAGLIVGFGLLDAPDGALAREQKSDSKLGMFFDATTDRLKEVILYSALAVYLSRHFPDAGAWLAAALAGSSLLVSYVKAKGEMAISSRNHNKQALNNAFGIGIARYEVRMAFLVLGLLMDLLVPILRFVIALNIFTASMRFLEIAAMLHKEDQEATKKK